MQAFARFGVIVCFYAILARTHVVRQSCDAPDTANEIAGWACSEPYQTEPFSSCYELEPGICHTYTETQAPSPQTLVSRKWFLCRAYNDAQCQEDTWAPITEPGMFNVQPEWVLSISCRTCPCGDCSKAFDIDGFRLDQTEKRPVRLKNGGH